MLNMLSLTIVSTDPGIWTAATSQGKIGTEANHLEWEDCMYKV